MVGETSPEKITEALTAPPAITGTGVIEDLCSRIAQKLALNCDLRSTDAYRSYSATVQITMRLEDVADTEVTDQIAIGTIHPDLPSEQITVDVPERVYVSRLRAKK